MALTLYRYGEAGGAAPWVLVHGWGFSASVLAPLARSLAGHGQVVAVDLPGCGGSPASACSSDPFRLAGQVAAAVPRPARWLGWSLGGLVALAAAARDPDAVTGVDLLAASPRFTAAADWPGTPAEDLEAFAARVAADPVAAHRRFLGFQLAGSEGAPRVLRELRRLVAAEGLPAPAALSAGLELLRACDLRAELAALSCPVRAVLGDCDPLIPVATAGRLATMGTAVHRIGGAGHVPFRSHPEAVAAALLEFA